MKSIVKEKYNIKYIIVLILLTLLYCYSYKGILLLENSFSIMLIALLTDVYYLSFIILPVYIIIIILNFKKTNEISLIRYKNINLTLKEDLKRIVVISLVLLLSILLTTFIFFLLINALSINTSFISIEDKTMLEELFYFKSILGENVEIKLILFFVKGLIFLGILVYIAIKSFFNRWIIISLGFLVNLAYVLSSGFYFLSNFIINLFIPTNHISVVYLIDNLNSGLSKNIEITQENIETIVRTNYSEYLILIIVFEIIVLIIISFIIKAKRVKLFKASI